MNDYDVIVTGGGGSSERPDEGGLRRDGRDRAGRDSTSYQKPYSGNWPRLELRPHPAYSCYPQEATNMEVDI